MEFPLEIWDTDAERCAILVRAIEASSEPMAVVDPIGNVVFLNEAAAALWNESPEALVNRAMVSLLGLDMKRAEADAFGDRLDRGEPWEGRVHPRKEGANRRLKGRKARFDPVSLTDRRKRRRVLGGIVTLSPTADKPGSKS